MIGIKRAFIHMLFERKKTTLKIIFYSLIFYIFMIMAFVSLVAQKQVSDMEAGVGNAVQITKVGQGEDERGKSGAFTEDEIEKLSSHPEVRTYNTLTNGYGNIENTEPYIQKDKMEEYEAFQKEKGGTDMFMFIGVRTSANAPMFSGAGYELVKGAEIKEDDKNCILVSDKLATKNGLNVGDKVILQTGRIYRRAAEPQEVTVKGIFKCPSQKFTEGYQYVPYWQAENQVFVVQETLRKMNDINYPVNQVFVYLKKNTAFDSYSSDMKSLLGETVYDDAYFCDMKYVYTRNDQAYEKISLPLREICDSAMMMSIVIGAGSYIILILICAWFLKGKKRETGIYLAMGEKKSRIFVQTLVEELAPMVIAVVIAAIVVFATAAPVSKGMMKDSSKQVNEQMDDARTLLNIETQGNDMYIMSFDLSGGGLNYFQASTEIHVYESMAVFAKYILAGVIFIGITVAAQEWWIMRGKVSDLVR